MGVFLTSNSGKITLLCLDRVLLRHGDEERMGAERIPGPFRSRLWTWTKSLLAFQNGVICISHAARSRARQTVVARFPTSYPSLARVSDSHCKDDSFTKPFLKFIDAAYHDFLPISFLFLENVANAGSQGKGVRQGPYFPVGYFWYVDSAALRPSS